MRKRFLFKLFEIKLIIAILITAYLYSCSIAEYESHVKTKSEPEGQVKIYNGSDTHIPNGSSFDFGELTEGLTSSVTLTIVNNYYKEIELKSYSLSDQVNFTINNFIPGKKIAKGQSFSFQLQFNPTGNSVDIIQDEYLTIYYSDNKSYSINLEGKVIDAKGKIKIFNQDNVYIANTGLINFKDIQNGTTKNNTLTIVNNSYRKIELKSYSLSDPDNFTVNGILPGTILAKGQHISFQLKFNPTKKITHTYNNATMTICYDNNESYILKLSGKGIEPADRISITLNGTPLANNSGLVNLNSIECKTTKKMNLRIKNTYPRDIELKSFKLSDNNNFTVKNFTDNSVINPGKYKDIIVEFRPVKNFYFSTKNATLSISYDEKKYTLKLKGEAYYEGKVILKSQTNSNFFILTNNDKIYYSNGSTPNVNSSTIFILKSYPDNTFTLMSDKNNKYVSATSSYVACGFEANGINKDLYSTFTLKKSDNNLYALKAHINNHYLAKTEVVGTWLNIVTAISKTTSDLTNFHIVELED